MEVRHEAFCEQPMETFRRVLEFAELPASPALERAVRNAKISSTSNHWRDDLALEQQVILDDILRDDLARYGYDERAAPARVPEAVAR